MQNSVSEAHSHKAERGTGEGDVRVGYLSHRQTKIPKVEEQQFEGRHLSNCKARRGSWNRTKAKSVIAWNGFAASRKEVCRVKVPWR